MITHRRWQLSLVTCAAGASLVLGLGAGTAAADTGAGNTASQSSDGASAAKDRRDARRAERTARQAQRADDRAERAAERADRRSERAAARRSQNDSETASTPLRDTTPRPSVIEAADDSVSSTSASGTVAGLRTPPVTVPSVDVDQYLGTWYEVGSVKQFFSVGLVNTKAEYSLNPDGTIKVVNSGNYFFNKGPKSSINGTASPVDDTNAKLNVTFFGPPSDKAPGNYWIVDLGDDYQYAIVTDPTGLSGFILSRDPVLTPEQYQALKAQAKASGVRGIITKTRQPGARQAAETATATSVF
ncbi:lipocalin family protein [Mycolicibacterium sp. 018/SC-01/001]|uniref:lipocalin family protein n=1 Tax=Mycolicibacterium sp. 018/SC-01/001 TaxID=2592069 RepID=UPI00117E4C58|nr:lipocalin family protein [Mycolicibacterium sp. 018/SC-01/001]TRW77901.1 lipocalin family protein [Mycolicibacterium sp. 018/SC-01/001]